MKKVMPYLCNLYDRCGGKRLLRLLALLLAFGVAPTVAFAQERDRDRDSDHGPGTDSIVGSWIVEVSPNPPGSGSFKNLGTFTEDGGNINSDPTFGGGHGLWKKVAPRMFAIKFLTIVPPGFESSGLPPETILTVSSEALKLNLQGDRMEGSFKTVFTPPNGQTQFLGDGTVRLTRITFGSTP